MNDVFPAARRRVLVWAAALCALALGPAGALRGAALAEPPPTEMQVKAAFVLNFIRLVNWAGIPGDESNPALPVCALANSDFADAVRQSAAGKTVGNRSISFRLSPNPDPAHCRVLLVDATQYPTARQALAAVQDGPVLTIGNGPGFLRIGGMLELSVRDRQVQFDAGLEPIRRSRLDVSARLLQLSRNLRKGPHGVF
jgi:hypothetical protein